VLFTFPSRYWFTIGHQGVFSLARWSSQIPTGFLVSRGTQVPVQQANTLSPTGLSPSSGRPFQTVQLRCWLVTRRPYGQAGPTTPPCKHDGLGYFRVRSPLLAESLLFSFPVGTEMVHFPTLPSMPYVFRHGYPGISQGGLPHSEIAGSKPVCGSPTLIAAYHVLHRLLVPRHSPYALSSFTITSDFASVSRHESVFHTALCACNRNYLLQDIQLSKIRFGSFELQRDRTATKVAVTADPLRRLSWHPPTRCRLSRLSQPKLVENTGLEPVTSWLQTRRSPS
jgi:hypothetical protein